MAELMCWCFVGFTFFGLWTVAWQTRNLTLRGVCMLVTVLLLYMFYKKYQQIRDSGLTL